MISITLRFATIAFLTSVLGLAACEKEGSETTTYYTVNVPVYALRVDVQDSIRSLPAQAICTPGNIYAKNDLLFVNELNRGWHVIDNANPASPREVAYWQVPGSNQLAFVDGKIVTDCYGDLLALEVGADLSLSVHSVAFNLLSGRYGYNRAYTYDVNGNPVYDSTSSRVITGYRLETREYTYDETYESWCCFGDCAFVGNRMSASFAADLSSSSGGVEAQGSLSRFATYQDYIYSVESYRIGVYQLTDSIRAVAVDGGYGYPQTTYLSEGETAVVDGDQLFVGSARGMYIFSLADPRLPRELSYYQHNYGCDPVAVSGDRAVVTVRDGTACRSERRVNTLAVINIADPNNPRELSITDMKHPHGVAIYDDRLYVSEGTHGLKVYDFSGDRRRPGKLLAESATPSVDIMMLPYSGGTHLLSVAPATITQYSTDDARPLALQSSLETGGCR